MSTSSERTPARRDAVPRGSPGSPGWLLACPLQVADDEVVVVKMNPVNEYLGPFLRQARHLTRRMQARLAGALPQASTPPRASHAGEAARLPEGGPKQASPASTARSSCCAPALLRPRLPHAAAASLPTHAAPRSKKENPIYVFIPINVLKVFTKFHQTPTSANLCRRAFQPLVDAGFLEFVYGAGQVGAYLCGHPVVSSGEPPAATRQLVARLAG